MLVFCLWLYVLPFCFPVSFFTSLLSSFFPSIISSLLCWPLALSIHTSAADGPRVHILFFFLFSSFSRRIKLNDLSFFGFVWVIVFRVGGLPGLEKSCYF